MSKIRILIIVLCLGAIGCAGSGPDLVGSWRLTGPDGRGHEEPTTMVKNLTETHFAFGVQTGDGPFSGGGTWSLEGDAYVENIQWHSLGVLVGRSITFSCKVEGDRWYHTADFIADGERFHIEEVWERVKHGKTREERAARH